MMLLSAVVMFISIRATGYKPLAVTAAQRQPPSISPQVCPIVHLHITKNV